MERKLKIIIDGGDPEVINAGSKTAEEHQHNLMYPLEGAGPKTVRVIEQKLKPRREPKVKSYGD